jgi:hypothetical protein
MMGAPAGGKEPVDRAELATMDDASFDRLTRLLGLCGTRRSVVAALLAAGGRFEANATEAAKRKRRRKRRKKRRCTASQVRCGRKCIAGNCCADEDCPPIGNQCLTVQLGTGQILRQCRCNGALCEEGFVCLPTGCCIDEGQPDQGAEENCCSGLSENGTCECLPNGEDDLAGLDLCCSGVSLGGECCIADGQDDGGNESECCSQRSENGVCECRPDGQTNLGHPGGCCSLITVGSVCGQPASPPVACTRGGAGVAHGTPWVVCHADANSAWLASTGDFGASHRYDPVAACASLGYGGVGDFGGTGAIVCGAGGDTNPSCTNPGTEAYSSGAYDPEEDYSCGAPGIICNLVQWECVT